MSTPIHQPCCPEFDPAPWNETELQWHDKRFVKDRVTSFLHIPLNFGAVIQRNMQRIEAAGAMSQNRLILSDENSLWGADVLIEVTRDIPGATMVNLEGTFLSKVFEGPYQKIRSWIDDMKGFVQARGHKIHKLYFYYTTCPKCAKRYGKNPVVLLAQIQTAAPGALP